MSKDSKALQKKGKLLTFIPTGEYYFSKGIKAYQRRDFHKSKTYLERALHLEPGEPMIVCQLAIVHTELGDYKESNRFLHLILEELDEHMVECHYFLANNYAHLGLFKDAYHHATQYMKLDEDGEFAEDTEDLLDLLTLEAEALEEDIYEQDDLITKQEEARELLESGHFPKAVKLLKSVIKEYPEYWSAYNNLALAYFYLGEVEKADGILNDVLNKNQGNLHALCNKLVFAHYLKDREKVQHLAEILKKIKPILVEHQFKLGATFALIGEYEQGYHWLKKLYKQGFDGDGPFYYWLSYSAYFTGREKMAEVSWKRVLEINPEKEGLEPWNDERSNLEGFEAHISTIHKKLESDYLEERLFGLFLTSVSKNKEDILESSFMQDISNKRSPLEDTYLSFIKEESQHLHQMSLQVAHETAKELYQFHQPIGTVEAGLYLMWFTVSVEFEQSNVKINNYTACAAAIEYVWRKLRNEKYSQQSIAAKYGISTSTMQKYVKLVNSHLQ
ncbi:tetratricopeptide repeat protein [Bacillus sp. 31A1R]|uniref:Tetratricopeptide repeat protein n=1 Tax=Robertmurraya mangrovi TaxID=3098077 RepID=A0ABU5J472_9BACI|nr:tetratricopeptide repeat protein [Bacillus sp. 31A1R]MDZ5474142.1 tetratricopeptide repeat protein [Bacillus sp. 31A1R]